ncbi:hypothetical protein TNCV_2855411 [Trichonephila clavipes]|nr:hypothetical protein TNCV_2855411 [Trichonephila clavipes]
MNDRRERKRKLDLTGASEMNRLYPNSRRESIKEDKYLNTLPRRGGGWRKKRPNENETKVRQEGRNGGAQGRGGLNSPKNAFEEYKSPSIYSEFRTLSREIAKDIQAHSRDQRDEKMDGDCKAKLAVGTVGFEAGVSLFTDPISDEVKCI